MTKFIVIGFIVSFIMWILFATVMTMRDRNELGNLPGWLYFIGRYVLLPVGAVIDAAYNWSFAIVLFLDLPREIMLTGRLKRYLHEAKYYGTWRFKLAMFFCKRLIEPWDQDHCGLTKVQK